MIVISILSFSQGTSIGVVTGGFGLAPALFLGWSITILPMVILAVLDHYGLKRRDIDPPNLLITVIFAAILPSYIFTAGYLIFRSPYESLDESA